MVIQIDFSYYFILIFPGNVSLFPDVWMIFFSAVITHFKNVVLFGHFNGILSKKGDKFVDTIHHLDTVEGPCPMFSGSSLIL